MRQENDIQINLNTFSWVVVFVAGTIVNNPPYEGSNTCPGSPMLCQYAENKADVATVGAWSASTDYQWDYVSPDKDPSKGLTMTTSNGDGCGIQRPPNPRQATITFQCGANSGATISSADDSKTGPQDDICTYYFTIETNLIPQLCQAPTPPPKGFTKNGLSGGKRKNTIFNIQHVKSG